jgi:hypothetical protein
VNYDQSSWGISLYADHYFEDHSSMFHLDYDGYGTGANWNKKEDSRFFVYDLKDIMLGCELRLNSFRWVNTIVLEYLYTKYQSGPVYHDHTPTMPDHVSGIDDYYNHHIFLGWQHWGQVMGNPLYRSPLYNTDQAINVNNNRFWAWHLGVSGNPMENIFYRVLLTTQKGWGRYHKPLVDPANNTSMLVEAEYRLKRDDWRIKGSFGLDSGKLLGDNVGVQLTVSRRFDVK